MIKWLDNLWFNIQFKFAKINIHYDIESGDDSGFYWVATKKVRGVTYTVDQRK